MKILSCLQNDNHLKTQKQNITFEAGLTPKMWQEIQGTDVLSISNKLAKKGIPTDFQGNKIIAWCSDKSVEIFEQLNKQFGTNFRLPKGIYVEDFNKLNIDDSNLFGFCNAFPTELKKSSTEIIDGGTLWFNSFETALKDVPQCDKWAYDWNNINEITDKRFAKKSIPTDHFLYTPIHEFAHNTHEFHILGLLTNANENNAGNMLLELFELTKNPKYIAKFKQKNERVLSGVCKNATIDPAEAIACDIPRHILSSLDKDSLMLVKNPFKGAKYYRQDSHKPSLMSATQYLSKNVKLNNLLRNFWNGKF